MLTLTVKVSLYLSRESLFHISKPYYIKQPLCHLVVNIALLNLTLTFKNRKWGGSVSQEVGDIQTAGICFY